MTTLQIFADYHQIYLSDPDHTEDWSDSWNDQTLDDRLIVLPHTAVFVTGRNMDVPVDVVVHSAQPDLDALIAAANHAVLGGITCAGGTLKICGLTSYLPDAFALEMSKGSVGFVFLSIGLDKIEPVERLDGEDRYALHVWPAAAKPETAVLKRWTEPAAP